MTECLGAGTTANVFKVTLNGEDVAIKVFRPKFTRTAQLELDFMRRYHHPHILHPAPDAVQNEARDMFETGTIVLELCTPVTEKRAAGMCLARWLVEFSSAVAYLHERGIMHCDLKPENMFINKNTLQVGDLGLATVSPCDSEHCQSPPYAPPEASVDGQFVAFPADVWAFVVTCIEMTSSSGYVFGHRERGPDLLYQNSEPIRDMQGFLDRIHAPPFVKTMASLGLREADERPSMAELATFLDTIVRDVGGETNVFK